MHELFVGNLSAECPTKGLVLSRGGKYVWDEEEEVSGRDVMIHLCGDCFLVVTIYVVTFPSSSSSSFLEEYPR